MVYPIYWRKLNPIGLHKMVFIRDDFKEIMYKISLYINHFKTLYLYRLTHIVKIKKFLISKRRLTKNRNNLYNNIRLDLSLKSE